MRYPLFYLQILPVFTESVPHNHHHTPHHHITPHQMRGIICNRILRACQKQPTNKRTEGGCKKYFLCNIWGQAWSVSANGSLSCTCDIFSHWLKSFLLDLDPSPATRQTTTVPGIDFHYNDKTVIRSFLMGISYTLLARPCLANWPPETIAGMLLICQHIRVRVYGVWIIILLRVMFKNTQQLWQSVMIHRQFATSH